MLNDEIKKNHLKNKTKKNAIQHGLVKLVT